MKYKDVVVGLGEIGKPILKILSKTSLTVGYDINEKLMNKNKFAKFESINTNFLQICIPYTDNFLKIVLSLNDRFKPKCIIIHSTVAPFTTKKIQNNLSIPVIYSPTRGIHKRMISDLKKYTKFFAIEENAPRQKWAISSYQNLMKKCKIKTKKMSSSITLELAKIVVDTSYYGWLINYAQLSNIIAIKHKVSYEEMWSFADEIHNFLGNRPKLLPGFIGGHCVIPNLDLIDNQSLDIIKEINDAYLKQVPNAKAISKKYDKTKTSPT